MTHKMKLGTVLVALVVLIAGSLSACGKAPVISATNQPAGSKDIVINKGDITDTATFIPYQSGNIKMEVIAVKAPDGTIRTAFNTCQVCFDSGRGYYVQKGDKLVCQNCGNQFAISRVEKEKAGCNPVPILEENKKDDGTTVTISASYLDQNKDLFENWKTR